MGFMSYLLQYPARQYYPCTVRLGIGFLHIWPGSGCFLYRCVKIQGTLLASPYLSVFFLRCDECNVRTHAIVFIPFHNSQTRNHKTTTPSSLLLESNTLCIHHCQHEFLFLLQQRRTTCKCHTASYQTTATESSTTTTKDSISRR